MKKKISNYILILLFISFSISCEDEVPYDFIEQNILIAVLKVNEPISGIELRNSQNLNDSIDTDKTRITDAEIIIKDGQNNEFKLEYDEDNFYYLPNQNYLVKANTEYSIEVLFGKNKEKLITGNTITPGVTKWIDTTDYYLTFPKDTLNPVTEEKVIWEPVDGNDFFVITITNLDTLNYGKYLETPIKQLNRRIERPWLHENSYESIQTIGIIRNNQTPIIWSSFKWFGLHEIGIKTIDYNYLMYFLQVRGTREINELFQSVEGDGFGVFASYYKIDYQLVLLKNPDWDE